MDEKSILSLAAVMNTSTKTAPLLALIVLDYVDKGMKKLDEESMEIAGILERHLYHERKLEQLSCTQA